MSNCIEYNSSQASASPTGKNHTLILIGFSVNSIFWMGRKNILHYNLKLMTNNAIHRTVQIYVAIQK